jgi:hypothetical protein
MDGCFIRISSRQNFLHFLDLYFAGKIVHSDTKLTPRIYMTSTNIHTYILICGVTFVIKDK